MNRSLPRFLYYLLTATLLQSIVFAQSPVERAMPDPLRLLQDTASITGGSMATDESFREDNAKVLRDRLQQAERRGNLRVSGMLHVRYAGLFLRTGAVDSAVFHFQTAVKAFSTAGMPRGEALAQTGIGLTRERTGDVTGARAAYTAALGRARDLGDQPTVALLNALIVRTYENETGSHAKALPFAREAFLSTPANAACALATRARHYGELLLALERDAEALPVLKKSLEHVNTCGDRLQKAEILRDLGILSYRSGRYEEALRYFEKSQQADPKLPALRLMRDSYLKLYAGSRIAQDSSRSQYYSRLYRLFKDSVEQLLNSRMLSPDSFTRELAEKSRVLELIERPTALEGRALSTDQLAYNQQLTEAELERLKTEEALARMNQEKMQDKVADNEREEKIRELERQQALQELELSKKALRESRQRQLINLLLAGVVLIIAFLGFLAYRFRVNKKAHLKLDRAYSELKKTHQQLKATQEQLVHSEKMASLGQMTAGIAHEIQNPLNFVNNFAESSAELLEELRQAGSKEEQEELLSDLQINLGKIVHHGKRADGIVKSMLQHSRGGDPVKSMVQLNKLAEEYLHLAYHGMRAKDPGFNCRLEKQLDPALPEVPAVPQEIGRVLLNLLSNAFYAVGERTERLRSSDEVYHPEVRVSTVSLSRYVALSVGDNGTGIPATVRERIFEPFFTTKATGQGTGLGLSISYDIVKAHGGEMKVETEEGRGTIFTLLLPIA